jgi:hypothetical protein
MSLRELSMLCNFSNSATVNGAVCLCGGVSAQGQVAAATCSQSCPGNAAASCGDATNDHASVYTTPAALSGFDIADPGTSFFYILAGLPGVARVKRTPHTRPQNLTR